MSLVAASLAPATPAPSHKTLEIHFVDVEGGQATLFVTSENHSLLIDTGWPGNNGRDADRIVAAAKVAGISKIEYVLITHFHTDHVGGVPQLVARIPVGTFIDHGENRETSDGATMEAGRPTSRCWQRENPRELASSPAMFCPFQICESAWSVPTAL
jgi:competence protein ComEC